MRLRRKSESALRVEVQMTSMIDVVFQLLIFFVMSLRIVQAEGDITVKLPIEADPTPHIDRFVPPINVRLAADARGGLAGVTYKAEPLDGLSQLRGRVVALVAENDGDGSQLSIDLVCDEGLHYEHVVAALTAISGRRDARGKIVPLVADVRLRK